jgi:hypothetical protein
MGPTLSSDPVTCLHHDYGIKVLQALCSRWSKPMHREITSYRVYHGAKERWSISQRWPLVVPRSHQSEVAADKTGKLARRNTRPNYDHISMIADTLITIHSIDVHIITD